MNSSIEGKRILITGASRGLGAVAAVEFSKLGAKLVLCSRDEAKLQEVRHSCRNPESHLVLSADLLQTTQIVPMVTKAESFLGQIDTVLHVAGGGLGLREPLLSSEDLYKLFTLNLGCAAEINRVVAPKMQARKSGNLVHVGSIASTEGVGSVGYNSVKAGLAAYVRTLGAYLAADQVIATGILPGGFLAPGNSMDRLRQNKPEVFETFVRERLPRKQMALAEEIIPLLAFLCSDAASMMGGCLVPIDAGEGKAYLTQ